MQSDAAAVQRKTLRRIERVALDRASGVPSIPNAPAGTFDWALESVTADAAHWPYTLPFRFVVAALPALRAEVRRECAAHGIAPAWRVGIAVECLDPPLLWFCAVSCKRQHVHLRFLSEEIHSHFASGLAGFVKDMKSCTP